MLWMFCDGSLFCEDCFDLYTRIAWSTVHVVLQTDASKASPALVLRCHIATLRVDGLRLQDKCYTAMVGNLLVVSALTIQLSLRLLATVCVWTDHSVAVEQAAEKPSGGCEAQLRY